jgi:hypothetical protein
MTTEKQIQANQDNALKGGVKTQSGKEVSKYNAEKHGILRAGLNDHEKAVYDKLMERNFEELQPQTQVEEMLIHQLTFNLMQLFRCQNEQNKQFYLNENLDRWDEEYFTNYNSGNLSGGRFLILNRYETNLENRIGKLLNQLERFSRQNKGEYVYPPLTLDINNNQES